MINPNGPKPPKVKFGGVPKTNFSRLGAPRKNPMPPQAVQGNNGLAGLKNALAGALSSQRSVEMGNG